MATEPATPSNSEEWQAAIDAAEFCLLLDSARQYGLIEGGPGVDVARCEDILQRGAALGYRPQNTR